MTEPIKLTIDGVEVEAKPGQTVLQAAIDNNVYIPYLCYWPGMKPYGACRMCCVEVEGGRGTPASCTLPVAEGMVVSSLGQEIRGLRESVMELLLSEHPHGCLTCHRIELCGPQDICLRHVRVLDRCVVCPKNERCELKDTVRYVNVNMESPLAYNYRNLQVETGDPFYDRDYNLCIVCARCVRVCEEMRGDDAIAMIERSGTVLVGTSQGMSLLESGCEFCGACIDVCPVGALVERDHKWDKAVETVKTTCTHCPVGCQVDLEVDRRGRVIRSIGDWESPVNTGQLCYMGKFGNEFVNSRNRLRTPMLRQHGELVEATWEQALEAIASRLPDYKGGAFSLFLTPRATNQQAFLAGIFAREVMGTSNVDLSVDHRPELVEPLARRLGTAAATGALAELENAGCVLVVNANVTEEHNVAAIPIKKTHKAGGKLIVIDTREVELSRYADLWLRPYPGTERALVGGMLRVILDEGLQDDVFIAERSGGLDALRESLAGYTLDAVADATGVAADRIAAAATAFAQAGSAAVIYALDNVAQEERVPVTDALVNLAIATGNVGKPATGLFPLRPGAASQGALDVGCSPGDDGLSAPRSLEAIAQGDVNAAMVLGDSALFTPEAVHTLTHTDFLVVQAMFSSELTEAADVLLPMTSFAEEDGVVTSLDRWVLRRRAAIEPKGEARPADAVLTQLARRMGVDGFGGHPSETLQAIRDAVPAYAAATDYALDAGGVQLPWSMPERAELTPLAPMPARAGDAEFLFAPGRVLSLPVGEVEVVRSNGKNAIRREDALELHPDDAAALGVGPGDVIDVGANGHRIRGLVRTTGPLRGVVSATVLFGELATALDQSPDDDPMLRVPGLHIMPVQVSRV
ncbi:MAG: molybdopterin-dependent oxidoreductase [Chloroflexota bacterium]|nr:molybdopterin-dependent oxidoreductase [Chloroflexota bacterium]